MLQLPRHHPAYLVYAKHDRHLGVLEDHNLHLGLYWS